MSEEKKHIVFSAADIEKYHKGRLSPKERHDLEKAALDDPFLSDALEGYAVNGVNTEADIADLKNRLSEKTERGKIIPLSTTLQTKFVWRIAAIIVVLLGAGFLVYQFGFNNKKENIAQNTTGKTEEVKTTDSSRFLAPIENKNETTNQVASTKTEKIISVPKKDEKVTVTKENFGAAKMKQDTVSLSFNAPNKQSQTVSPQKEIALQKNEQENLKDEYAANTKNEKIFSEKQIAGQPNPANKILAKSDQDRDGTKDQLGKAQKSSFFNSNTSGLTNRRNENYLQNNIFRGRVTDANNNPLPFANITATQDSVGTYADAKGYFNLTSPDSVLNVQVQSLGYANINTELKNRNSNNSIILKEDKSLPDIVLTNKKPNTDRAKIANLKVQEEPEPEDGWEKYDLYLANNLKVPDIIRSKNSNGEVEVSFEVDKNGDPTSIKVEKSLCNECDKEAIRLIKEGPKWKHKSKKKRTTVKISF